MTCHDYKDLMMGYLDNELSEEQRRQFEEHLSGCPECKKELEEFKKLKAITDEVTLAEP
jgi:anti-sigma factor RsiW